mgnify:CR=1 FL=1
MPKIKNIIIFTAIAAAFILIYIFFIKPSPEQASLVSSEASAILPNIDGSVADTSISNKNSLIAKDFLALFSNIKNIKLNDAIFSDPAFVSLHDSSITLTPDGTEGRPNPFAQFGNDAVLPASSVPSAPLVPSPSIPIRP